MPEPEEEKPKAEEKDEDLAPPADEPAPQLGDSRKLYRETYADMELEQRIALAKTADSLIMRALAFDPVPRVISALMENPNFSVQEARVIAREHPSSVGLGMIASTPRMLADPEVRRRLLRNQHVSTQIMGLLLRGKPLISIYQVSISHDVPENSKSFARAELRRAFSTRDPEEKVALIIKTDGRVLALVVGIGLDGRTISMIVGRTAMSSMLARAFAQWPTTPPPILQAIYKLPQVQRDKSLMQVLLRHPNLPSQLKRQ
jgi:hypothetical protein